MNLEKDTKETILIQVSPLKNDCNKYVVENRSETILSYKEEFFFFFFFCQKKIVIKKVCKNGLKYAVCQQAEALNITTGDTWSQ